MPRPRKTQNDTDRAHATPKRPKRVANQFQADPSLTNRAKIAAAFSSYLEVWRDNAPGKQIANKELPLVIACFKRHYGLHLSNSQKDLLRHFERDNPPIKPIMSVPAIGSCKGRPKKAKSVA